MIGYHQGVKINLAMAALIIIFNAVFLGDTLFVYTVHCMYFLNAFFSCSFIKFDWWL